MSRSASRVKKPTAVSVLDEQDVARLTDQFLEELRETQGDRTIYERTEVHESFSSFVRVKKAPRAIAERIRDRVLRAITLSEAMPA